MSDLHNIEREQSHLFNTLKTMAWWEKTETAAWSPSPPARHNTINLVEVDYGSVCGCWKSVWNNNVHNTAKSDMVKNLGLVGIVSVWSLMFISIFV